MSKLSMLVVWLTLITIGVVAALWRQVDAAPDPAPLATAVFDQIDVHRINVLEPDGKPRVIISNTARYPGAIFDGKEYVHPDRGSLGGFLFYNDDGTEAGGLGYAGHAKGDRREAGAFLSMDQLGQNETLKLVYEEAGGRRGAGLVVYGDHPDGSLLPIAQASDARAKATTDEQRRALDASIERMVPQVVGEIAPRAFIGREGDDAHLVLSDKHGTPRLVINVDGAGSPTIEFLDATGKVTKRITTD